MYELYARVIGENTYPTSLGEFCTVDSARCFLDALALGLDTGARLTYTIRHGEITVDCGARFGD